MKGVDNIEVHKFKSLVWEVYHTQYTFLYQTLHLYSLIVGLLLEKNSQKVDCIGIRFRSIS